MPVAIDGVLQAGHHPWLEHIAIIKKRELS
jgi:hypothetical protein